MKKIMLMLLVFFVGIISFMLSWAFFMNSGILSSDFEMNETRSIEIHRAFDKMPFINLGREPGFTMWGDVVSVDYASGFIFVEDYSKEKVFYVENISDFKEGDEVRVRYSYDDDYDIYVVSVKRYMRESEVVDFFTCQEYRHSDTYHEYKKPVRCEINDKVFVLSDEVLQDYCEFYNGTWVDGFLECEDISRSQCYDLEGDYYSCESDCRNLPETASCSRRCVRVCSFRRD